MKQAVHAASRGFLLLEMVLALAVFGMAATGFVVALHRMSATASLAQSELRITRILDSALDETLSLPVLEEGKTNTSVGETGIELDTTIELIDDMENEEGQILQEMYRIEIQARWFANGQWQDRTVETWRYGRMYQQP
ncbi:MAG: type II secretion system protein [Verrucomicrobiaceae bacterium]|jgi:type II secretory pathway pseudopilin PulG|nr:MAG: type II secretion system protein [Verrucomicrobiaceae bacterium]